MSASSKKKLRNAQQAEKLTEKQLAEQKEAKKLKLYSTLAVVILIALVVFAAYVGVSRMIANSGIRERNTAALTIDDNQISNAELNYFFVDAVNSFYNQYGGYASLIGLDVTKPLDEQIVDEETQRTWADDFLETAVSDAKAAYAIAGEAKANGYTLPEEATTEIDMTLSNLATYSLMYGYPDVDTYLRAMYGNGASEESLRAYYELTSLARYYQSHYYDTLTYTDAELRAAEADNYNKYSSYTYNYYYLNATNFIEGEGTDYTEEQRAEGAKKAEEVAKSLTEGITTVEEFDAVIAALPMNSELSDAASYASEDVPYGDMFSGYAEWVADPARKAGEMTYVANVTNTTDENGNPVERISGYYVVMFGSCNDNNFPLANVRHILAAFEGGSFDSATGITTYSPKEKETAKAEAEAIYTEWKNGAATEESFAALANEKSDDGDGTTGGLFEDIYPGQMVPAFEDWCFGDHKVGDTDIVETEYGYHIMYYSGDSDTSYRDYLISNELATADFETWRTALIEGASVTEHSFKYVHTDLTLSAA